ncbi:MAG TPA: flagellar protein FlgN [Rhodocyclaceae bacterium]|jgi:flagellar biosynthesis protein FlgN|nr:flagellar protein FlgN [Rhodocyclaceae bacterium]HRQ45300.1 flagellar protein FlgN [Rhodocyclaceae bacterium]
MINPSVLARLAQFIDTEATLMRRFVALLEREEALLIAGETDALLALTREKSELYQQLQRQNDARALLLGRERLENTDASLRALCRAMPETLSRWDEILSLANEARSRNEINGKLITERMQHNQAALSVLLSAADQPQLYDAEGVARPTGRGRHLGSA